MNRRRFLEQSSSTLVGLSAGWLGAAAHAVEPAKGKETALPIVDTHVHLWDLSKFKLPWLKPDMPFNRSFVVADYRKATAGLNVVKGVYMEVDLEPSQQR